MLSDTCDFLCQRFIGRLAFSGYRLIVSLFILGMCSPHAYSQNISRQQVNNLLVELKTSRSDPKKISILLELGKFHLYKPGEARVDLDSSRMYLRQAEKLSSSLRLVTRQHEAKTLLLVADLEGGDTDTGQSRFADLISNCQQAGDKEGEAIARFRLGIWLRNFAPDSTTVLTNFRQVASIYQSLDKPVEEINTLKEIAITHLYEGQIILSEAELLNVLHRFKAIRYPNLHYTYDLLATIGRLKGDLNEALRYGLLCIESMNRTHDTASAAAFYGDLAQIYEVAGNHPKAIEWYGKSLAAWRQEGLPNFALYNAAGILAKDLIAQQKPEEALRFFQNLVKEIPTNTIIQKGCVAQNLAHCYAALKNDRLAERYYKEALYWYEKNKLDFEGSLQIRQDLGSFYVKQKRFKEAGFYLKKALTILPEKKALSTLRDIHFMLFKVDSAQGNYLSAINHFDLYKTFNDSLFNESRSKQLTQLQFQYDTRAKEQNIVLLTKQSELQQSALERAETTRNTMLMGAVLLVVLLGVSYNRYRLKQRSNQLLEVKQLEINQKNASLQEVLTEKEWMLKEIHHRVKNNLQIITSLLNAQADYLHDATALAAIRESQNRVQAMALIHQKLYQSEQLSTVDMAEYINEVVNYLLESFNCQLSIRTVLNVAPLQIDVNLATPLGLIINEAFTNALKYAFPQPLYSAENPGVVHINLMVNDARNCQLLIQDNGIGLPAGFDPNETSTLGLTMIQGLSRQISGKLHIEQESGVGIRLDFSPTKKIE
jgi:two-component system, sensor histidine kinase PdtaS